MRLTKRQWTILIVIILVLALLLFLLINISLFHRSMRIFEKAKMACEGLRTEDKCTFALDGRELEGVCKEDRQEVLVCKPSRPPRH
jgi:uncharacterized protein YpmB